MGVFPRQTAEKTFRMAPKPNSTWALQLGGAEGGGGTQLARAHALQAMWFSVMANNVSALLMGGRKPSLARLNVRRVADVSSDDIDCLAVSRDNTVDMTIVTRLIADRSPCRFVAARRIYDAFEPVSADPLLAALGRRGVTGIVRVATPASEIAA